MRNKAKYLLIYLCVLCILVGSAVNLAQAQQSAVPSTTDASQPTESALNQAQLEQLLAPIALYPDTLLSHILVAATYPLEVVQAARWRETNKDLNEQQALDAVENKDWAPSVKALVPFSELLATLNADLDWLQSLGSAFLFDEEKVLASVQSLRQKAYAQGNLNDSEYIEVDKNAEQIIIQSTQQEVVYVPYYDTRVVYGNWGWANHPPHYWHIPSHYVWSAGFYWSSSFFIRPSFYFSGFHWPKRHVVANYAYGQHRNNKYWSHSHSRKQRVKVTEYPRWTHSQHHRRGAHYKQNGKRIIRNSENPNRYVSGSTVHNSKKKHQIDKQRVLDINNYPHRKKASGQKETKRKLATFDKRKYANKELAKKHSNVTSSYRIEQSAKGNNRQVKTDKWQRNNATKMPAHSSKQKSIKYSQKPHKFQQPKANNRNKSNYHAKNRHNSGHTLNKSRPVKSRPATSSHSKSRDKR